VRSEQQVTDAQVENRVAEELQTLIVAKRRVAAFVA